MLGFFKKVTNNKLDPMVIQVWKWKQSCPIWVIWILFVTSIPFLYLGDWFGEHWYWYGFLSLFFQLMRSRSKKSSLGNSGSHFKPGKKPKFVVHAAGDVGISGDGYRWRKYGQKMVKGNPHPRCVLSFIRFCRTNLFHHCVWVWHCYSES